MRPGARVVSNSYNMGDWRSDRRQKIGESIIYMWVVPARVGGRWVLTDGNRRAELNIRQSYQLFDGSVTSDGRSGRIEQGQLNGARIHFVADLGGGRRVYEGRVDGDVIVPHRASAGWRASRAS